MGYLPRAFACVGGYDKTLSKRDPLVSGCLSIDAPTSAADGEDAVPSLGESIPDPSAEEAFAEVDKEILRAQLESTLTSELDNLPPKERRVMLMLAAGMNQGCVSRVLGITKSYVSLLRKKAEAHLKTEKLRDFL